MVLLSPKVPDAGNSHPKKLWLRMDPLGARKCLIKIQALRENRLECRMMAIFESQ